MTIKIGSLLFSAAISVAAPEKLSLTGLYHNVDQKTLAHSVLHYVPQYPLWSDGASKQRWIYLPPQTQIATGEPQGKTKPWEGTIDHWLFPVGTKFWKEFSFPRANKSAGLPEQKRIETRYLEKISDDEWIFASYLWNEKETDAFLVGEDGEKNVYSSSKNTYHSIPSTTECLRCHKRGGDGVLGFNAIQLSTERDPLAIHAEPLKEHSVTLADLIAQNRFTYVAKEFAGGKPKIDGRTAQERAVWGYLSSNCASCHNQYGSSMHVQMDLMPSLKTANAESEPALLALLNRATTVFSIPGMSKSLRVKAGNPEESALYWMLVNKGVSHMPPLGAEIRDTVALERIREWIKNQ